MRVRAPLVVGGAEEINIPLPTAPLHRYARQFVLQDEWTGEVLAGVLYKIYRGKELLLKGRSDKNGLTKFVTTENMEDIRIEIEIKE